ncbi:hypothetical protein BGZ96_011902 [Linnemannia gamsii]|uniref:RxLR effector protein n=1 Tax=Linnemannia gamsii TaxID=64522 RepID=A0ABQ7JRG6_9FUNG|nr:hypothetical protein BGZ96_011902 [Linnemannia gamsii]
MRHTSFALFVTVIGASILLSSTTTTDAAPVRRSPSADTISSTSGAIVSHKHKHNKKHNKKKSNNSNSKLNKFVIPDAELSGSTWYHQPLNRRALLPLEDHVVTDDDDDDAGNEMLDTEHDSGLERPDDDDTIEGQILEEEDLDDFEAVADGEDEEGVEGHLLQHTLRAANTAANVARARAAAMAAAARARAVESLDWLKESEFEGEEKAAEAVGDEEEVMKVVLSRFGGRAAAADMAAHAGEV